MDFLSLVVQVASILTLIVAIIAIFQTKKSRTDSLKPIIVPTIESEINSIEKLFAFNFDYPVQEFKYHGIVYFFIKNIGRGPACNVRIVSIKHNWEEINFNIGHQNWSNFSEGCSIPIILRLGFTETMFEFGVVRFFIVYEDITGKKYSLTVDAWLQGIIAKDDFICVAKVINYFDKKVSKKTPLPVVTFREIENSGYFELEKINKIKNFR